MRLAFFIYREEVKILSGVDVDVEKYVVETQDKFISGDASFYEWDDYIQTLDKIGLDKYMEVQEAAYARYLES